MYFLKDWSLFQSVLPDKLFNRINIENVDLASYSISLKDTIVVLSGLNGLHGVIGDETSDDDLVSFQNNLPSGCIIINRRVVGPTVNLTNANLSDSTITGVNLEGANLTNTNVTNCKIECSGIPASLPNGCAMCPVLTQQGNGHIVSSYRIVGPGMDLTGLNLNLNTFLKGKDLTGLDLTGLDFRGHDLTGTKF